MSSQPGFASFTYQAFDLYRQNWPRLLRTALWPFVVSVGFVSVGCPLGVPSRFAFDVVHLLMQISFITAVARIAMGTGPGITFIELAVPTPRCPCVRCGLEMLAASLLGLVPTVVLFVCFTLWAGPGIKVMDNIVLLVVSRIGPMFVMSAFVGLVIGVGMAKIAAKQQT